MSFTLTPGARLVADKTERAGLNARKKLDETMRDLADSCVSRVRSRILEQNFAPLSEKWSVRKRQRGLDPRILIATEKYLDSIKSRRVAFGDYGVEADWEKMQQAEFGSKTRRPRPHWAPVIRELEREVPGMVIKNVGDLLP